MHRYHISATLLILLYVSPFLVLGEHAHIGIHDLLDDINLIGYEILSLYPQYLFSGGDVTVPAYLGGLPRDVYPSELNLYTWFSYAFSTVNAFTLNQLLMRLSAYAGMFLLLREVSATPDNETRRILVLTSLAYALLPFWPSYLISVSGMPLVAWAFIRLGQKRRVSISLLVLTLYPMYSNFILGGMFAVFIGPCVLAWSVIRKRKCPWTLVLGIILIVVAEVLVNYRLFRLEFFSGFVSHRDEWVISNIGLFAALEKTFHYLLFGFYQVPTLHYPVILLAVAAGTVAQVLDRKPDKIFVSALVLLAATGFFYGFYSWAPFQAIKAAYFPFLLKFQLDRFIFMNPMIIYALFAVSLLLVYRRLPYGKHLALMLAFLQITVNLLGHPEIRAARNPSPGPSVQQFFARDLFSEIKADIGLPVGSYRVGSVGMHPSMAVVNGFSTIDGYVNLYPIEYKHKFARLIDPEIQKTASLREYFYGWGSRAYVFSAELEKNYMWSKSDANKIDSLSLNKNAFSDLGCKFIFSSVEIVNAPQNGLSLRGQYENPASYWRIFVYEVIE